MKEIFKSFQKSLVRLDEVLKMEKTVANRDSAIQRFEFTVELAWKIIQKFLRQEEIICRSPKECLREGFKFGLVQDDVRWIKMIEDRNLTVHAYDEKLADEIYSRLPGYLDLFKNLETEIAKRNSAVVD